MIRRLAVLGPITDRLRRVIRTLANGHALGMAYASDQTLILSGAPHLRAARGDEVHR